MATLRQVELSALFCFVMQLAKTTSLDSAVLYNISKPVTSVNSRVACSVTLQCTGETSPGGNHPEENLWHYPPSGGITSPVMNTSNFFVTTDVFNKSGADNVKAFVSSLTISPVVRTEVFFCIFDQATAVNVLMDQDPIEVVDAVPSVVDISDKRIGDIVTLSCDVDTCLMDIRVSFYKGQDLVHSVSSVHNRQRYIYKHRVSENSVGSYSYRVSARLASTPLLHFTITGSPLPALID